MERHIPIEVFTANFKSHNTTKQTQIFRNTRIKINIFQRPYRLAKFLKLNPFIKMRYNKRTLNDVYQNGKENNGRGK